MSRSVMPSSSSRADPRPPPLRSERDSFGGGGGAGRHRRGGGGGGGGGSGGGGGGGGRKDRQAWSSSAAEAERSSGPDAHYQGNSKEAARGGRTGGVHETRVSRGGDGMEREGGREAGPDGGREAVRDRDGGRESLRDTMRDSSLRDGGRRDSSGGRDSGGRDGGGRDAMGRESGREASLRDGGGRDSSGRDGGGARDSSLRDGGGRESGRDSSLRDGGRDSSGREGGGARDSSGREGGGARDSSMRNAGGRDSLAREVGVGGRDSSQRDSAALGELTREGGRSSARDGGGGGRDRDRDHRPRISARDESSAREASGAGGYGKGKDGGERARDWEQSDRAREKMDVDRAGRDKRDAGMSGGGRHHLYHHRQPPQQRRHSTGDVGVGERDRPRNPAAKPPPPTTVPSAGNSSRALSIPRSPFSPVDERQTSSSGEPAASSGALKLAEKDAEREPGELPSRRSDSASRPSPPPPSRPTFKPPLMVEPDGGGGTRKRKFSPIVWDYDEKQARPSAVSGGQGGAQPASTSSSVSVSLSPVENAPSPAKSARSGSREPQVAATSPPRDSPPSASPEQAASSPREDSPAEMDLAGSRESEQLSGSLVQSDDEPEPGQVIPQTDDEPAREDRPTFDGEEDDPPPPPMITIGASRWAGKARGRSSSGSESEEGRISGGPALERATSTSPELGEYVRERSDAGPSRGKERGNESDVSAGEQSSGDKDRRGDVAMAEDEDYEQELNKRELMELEEGESDEESREEQRPELEPDFVPALAPSGPLLRAIDMLQGCRSVDEFERLNRIDEGTYGVVYRARNRKTGEIVALKKVKMEKEKEGFPRTSLREINVLLSFHHSSVVNVKEVVVGSTIDSIFMVMEYMEHDLKGLMELRKQPFSQSEVKCLMLQLLEGVKYLHDNWVLHRDLKTSNLLLNNRGELKICDFGLARQYGSPLKAYTHLVVTLWYRAPELLLGSKNYQYSTAVDMWSLGCIMAEFLAKEPLFNGKSEIDQIDKIFKTLGTPNEDIWPGFANMPGVKCKFVRQPFNKLREKFPATAFAGRPALSERGFDLLNGLLTYDPSKRLTADEALNHDWFTEVPMPKSKEFMPTFPARSEHERRARRLMKSPDPLEEQRKREIRQAELGGRGLFG